MIYVGPDPDPDGWRASPFIDPELPVAEHGSDMLGQKLPYWPSYGHINPTSRATYLDWLAEGRSNRDYSPGYLFLYFYGIERRFFGDTSDDSERRLLVSEVERLLEVYCDSRSVQRYLSAFLDSAEVVLNSTGEDVPNFDFARLRFGLPLRARVAIGRMVREEQPLDADWLFAWALAHPETSLRTPARRAFREFKAMFSVVFDARFPQGLAIRAPKRMLRARYSAAAGTFEVDLNRFIGEIPDISKVRRPLTIANELVKEATDALDRYSRLLGRDPDARGTIKAHALLPEALWPLFPCAEVEELQRWTQAIIEAGGLVPVEELIERLDGALPRKLGKRRLAAAADALARLSIGMAPDPRFAFRGPKIGEPVVLFELAEGLALLEDVSADYKNTLVAIALGSFIAHADGSIATRERRALEIRIEASDLSSVERDRLHANLKWMLQVPPNIPLFRRRLREMPEDARRRVGQATLAMVTADGVVDPGELKAVERLYRAIGLPTDSVYSDLHALAAPSEPVTVRTATATEENYVIPIPPEEAAPALVLNSDRVASVIADTERAASILGDIFRGDDDEDESHEHEEVDERVDDSGMNLAGLNRSHADFVTELILRSHWEDDEFALLARQFEVMSGGAIEVINEWSFGRFGDALIEEYDGFDINEEIVANIRE